VIRASASPISRVPFSRLTWAATFDPTSDAQPDPTLEITLDRFPTPSSLFTRTKTDHRSHYDTARQRMGVPPLGTAPMPPLPGDVLLYNEALEITETSIRNIAFYRRGHWITPHAQTGCLPGVVRRYLLQHEFIQEAEPETPFHVDDIENDELVLLFNAVEGCRLGRIRLNLERDEVT
jgi:4-amino-4-deoxychorismate lyase